MTDRECYLYTLAFLRYVRTKSSPRGVAIAGDRAKAACTLQAVVEAVAGDLEEGPAAAQGLQPRGGALPVAGKQEPARQRRLRGAQLAVMRGAQVGDVALAGAWEHRADLGACGKSAYHLDGAEALAYARVRKYGGGDFGRAERQQQVALAVIDRVVGFDMIPMLVTKAPSLYLELSEGIRTNMSLDEMISLGWLAVQISKENIRQGVISPPKMVGFHTRPDGAQVLRAVPDQIRISAGCCSFPNL